jgi:hypothetical protein
MGALAFAALAVLLFAAVARRASYGRMVRMVVGICLAVGAIELAYRQGLGDGAKLAFYRPTLMAQQSQLLLYAAGMLGAAVVAVALAVVFRSADETPANEADITTSLP